MARNVLFLVHGIGEHGDGWAVEPLDALAKAASSYGFFQGKDLQDLVEFVPIRYDDIFDRILDQWGDLAEGLGGAGALLDGVLERAVKLMDQLNGDRSEFLTYGGDVLLYRGFRLFGQRVKIRVISTIASKIAERRAEGGETSVRFSVLAHSMGTAVAHDALQLLGTEAWLDEGYGFDADSDREAAERKAASDARKGLLASGMQNPFAPQFFRFDRILMVSNTSALLHTTSAGPYESIVRPNTPGHGGSYCERFYNVAHAWDPVSRLAPFRTPPEWKLGDGAVDVTNLRHVYGKNPHALSHYLAHPALHLRLLSALVDDYEISEDDRKKAAKFPDVDPAIKTKISNAVEKRFGALTEEAKGLKKITDLVEVWRKLQEIAEGLA